MLAGRFQEREQQAFEQGKTDLVKTDIAQVQLNP